MSFEAEQSRFDDLYWPGTDVLRNLLGIRDQDELAATEVMTVAAQLTELPDLEISWPGFLDCHRHLFGPLYSWAGETRTFPMLKTGADLGDTGGAIVHDRMIHYSEWSQLPATGKAFFDQLHNFNPIVDNEDFGTRAGWLAGGLNRLHPFREGNGRTISTFLTHWSTTEGYPVDFNAWPRRQWTHARYAAYDSDFSVMHDGVMAALKHQRMPWSSRSNPQAGSGL